ncbi:MAG: CcdB family protein [Parvularculaceae bacterium]
MARFDVYRFPSKAAPLVIDVQSNILNDLNSRVVIPLAPAAKADREQLPRLKPKIAIGEKDYILMTTDIAALPVNRLGDRVVNLEADYRDEITNALDFLFFGF